MYVSSRIGFVESKIYECLCFCCITESPRKATRNIGSGSVKIQATKNTGEAFVEVPRALTTHHTHFYIGGGFTGEKKLEDSSSEKQHSGFVGERNPWTILASESPPPSRRTGLQKKFQGRRLLPRAAGAPRW